MKSLLPILVLLPLAAAASVNTYTPGDGRLFVKNVSIDGAIYSNVTLTLRGNGTWTVDAATPGADPRGAEYPYASYDSGTAVAALPALDIDGTPLQNLTLLLNPEGGWELSLARAAPVAAPTDYNGTWLNEQKGLKYTLSVDGAILTLTNLRSSLIFHGTLNNGVAALVEDDAYLTQSATLTLTAKAATLRIESCQPKSQGYFCSKTLPAGASVMLYKQ